MPTSTFDLDPMTATMPKQEEETPSPSSSSSLLPGSTTCSTPPDTMALEELNPAPRLPPGVYFSPTKPESVLTYLNRWTAGDAMPDAAGWVIEDDVYAESPDVLTRRHRPASTRDGEPSWWFLCHCVLQPTRGGRGSRAQRGDRRVATGGHWKLEQTKQDVECAVSRRRIGFKRSFGFYYKVHGKEEEEEGERATKTWWLMEEFTSVACPEDGFAREDGKRVLPALCRIYVTPRDHEDKKGNNKRSRWDVDDCGENDDGAAMRGGRAVVPAACFDAIAALLPPSSVRGVGGQDRRAFVAPPTETGAFDDQCKRHEASSSDDDQDMWLMGRDAVLADSSWIDQHYIKPE